MLERLNALVASVLGSKTPLAVAALQAMGLLLEVLGEIPESQVDLLSGPVTAKLTGDSTCLRLQVLPLRSLLCHHDVQRNFLLWSQYE